MCVGARPSCWDFGDGATGRDREVHVHQGVGDIRQCLRKYAENLGDSTHPIGSIRLMQIMKPSSPGADAMPYVNIPT